MAETGLTTLRFSVIIVCVFLAPCNSQQALIDVRLVGGPTRYEGTVEVTADGITWYTTCGSSIAFSDAAVICSHLGFTGTNRGLTSSTFGNNQSEWVTLTCSPGGDTISSCRYRIQECPSGSDMGGVVCHDERYLGCYRDSRESRVLTGKPCILQACEYTVTDLTINKCIDLCRNASYDLAGVEYGGECYCGAAGTDYNRLGKLEDDQCYTQCTGTNQQSCGGSGAIAVFTLLPPTTSPASSTDPMTTSSLNEASSVASSTDTPLTTGMGTNRVEATSKSSGMSGASSMMVVYAAAGGGIGAFIILLVIVVIIVIFCRRSGRNSDKSTMKGDPGLEMGKKGLQPQYENNSMTKNDYNYMNTGSGMATGPNHVYEDSDLHYAMTGASAPVQESDLDGLYAMSGGTATMEGSDFSALYAQPNKPQPEPDNNTDFGALYAQPNKPQREPENDADFGALYAKPNKPQLEPENDANFDASQLYAMPNRNVAREGDETVMVDNELYGDQGY